MAKYKYLRGGRVFESDKKYNLPQIGPDGKLITPTKKQKQDLKKVIKDSPPSPEMTKWTNKNLPWTNPDRKWYGGDTNLGKGSELYINDAGNLSKIPTKKPSPLQLPTVKQDATRVAKRYNEGGFMKAAGAIAPFMDNFANLITTAKTPNIPAPILTSAPRLNTTFNIAPQLRQINDQSRAANIAIDRSTSNAGVAAANKGSVLANKLRAVGDLSAQKQNIETDLQNRAKMFDYQARANNNQILNQYNFNKMMREDDVNQRYAAAIGDFGTDIANINRERNQMDLDRERMQLLSKINPDANYQFSDSKVFEDLYKDNEPALRQLIKKQKGSVPRERLISLYKRLYKKDFID